jgi:hypothetical protein
MPDLSDFRGTSLTVVNAPVSAGTEVVRGFVLHHDIVARGRKVAVGDAILNLAGGRKVLSFLTSDDADGLHLEVTVQAPPDWGAVRVVLDQLSDPMKFVMVPAFERRNFAVTLKYVDVIQFKLPYVKDYVRMKIDEVTRGLEIISATVSSTWEVNFDARMTVNVVCREPIRQLPVAPKKEPAQLPIEPPRRKFNFNDQ